MSVRKRESWLDMLRIVSAFLVIVNHTNSRLFQALTPAQGTWWLSVAWYYASRLAVPVFVLVSGAVLLPGQDDWKKTLSRFGRVLAALVVFSYGYYLHDAWVYWGLWPRMINLPVFFEKVLTGQITDGFWYLYFYMGLMLLLPLLQRMAHRMTDRQMLGFIGLCYALGAVWPLAGHYLPALAMPEALCRAPVGYIGLFFAGHWIRSRYVPEKRSRALAAGVLAAGLAISVWLTRVEFDRVLPNEKYWFMDNRWQPSVFIIFGAMALLMLAKGRVKERRLWTELGSWAFGIYLVQDWLIAQTEMRLYAPLCKLLPAFPAMLVWEGTVFAIACAAAWVMRRIPVLKRIL